MSWRQLGVDEFNSMKNALVIDVRSPCEHNAERIPGSINIPLLSDDERAVIGTIYKEQGEITARREALRIIAPKITVHVEAVDKLRRHGQQVVVYCWRGGLRSEAVSSLLSIAGIDCLRLAGGYKAWRAGVVSDFQNDAYPFQAAVLVGLTGCGKTEILSRLEQEGLAVLDLERLANHRGSVFGGLGLGDQPSQKNFDAALWRRLKELPSGRLIFVEGESRKVGRVALPDCVYKRIQTGSQIQVTGTVERRAERITADYLHPDRKPEQEMARGLQLLDNLKERLGSKQVEALKELVRNRQIPEAVQILLTDYYDPLYRRQIDRCAPFELTVDGDDVEGAVGKIKSWAAQKELPPDKRGEGLVVVD